MKIKQKNYYVRANSSQGLINLLYSNVIGLKTGIILTGDYEFLKNDLLAAISQFLKDSDVPTECIHSCYEPDALEGLIIRESRIGVFSDQIMDDTTLRLFDNVMYVDMEETLSPNYPEIADKLRDNWNKSLKDYEMAYEIFARAIRIHDEWEKIYIDHMHFDQANQFADEFIDTLFSKDCAHEAGIARHRFFGGASYKGSKDYVMDLTDSYETRHFIKGRPGSGKSTFMKRIQAKAEELQYEVEVYHCGFDPNSLDMILIRDLGFCIFDSTAPHEYFPVRKGDIVVDKYESLIDPGTDEAWKPQLDEIRSRYQAQVKAGTVCMQDGKDLQNKINLELNRYVIDEQLVKKIHEVAQMIVKE